MRSMVSRTRSRITRSMVSAATSRPSPGSRFLLSLPTASSSGTRCPAGAVVGQLRRMMTPSFHFSTTRPTLPPQPATVRTPQTGNARGWGLGPTLVHGCAEAHGGRVRVDSDAATGTTFTLELPLDARPHQPRSDEQPEVHEEIAR